MRPKTIFKGEGLPPSIIHAKRLGTGKKIEKESQPIPRDLAISIGNDIISAIRVTDHEVRVSFAGSIRREVEQVHDIDILVSPFSEKVRDLITMWTNTDLLWGGNEKVSILMPTGDLIGSKIQVDVRFIQPESWGPALQYFTGSREHNISLRSIAKRRNQVLNEHGLFDLLGKRLDDGTEGGVYKALLLRWLPPKYRNGYIERTPRPTWCIDHQIKDWCKRSRLLARKSVKRKDAGNPGAPGPANREVPPKGGISLKSPDVIMQYGQDKTQDDSA
jgi:hypothetical protein